MLELSDDFKMTSPMSIFSNWFDAARTTNLKHPEAFVLSTLHLKSNDHGAATRASIEEIHSPFANTRVVLMKEHSDDGLIFYSNYQSQKGIEIDGSNMGAAHFYWDPLFRQIKIIGELTQTPREKSEAYWRTRPRDSQLSQWVSRQSQPVSNREQMESELAAAEKEFLNKEVPCPKHWGGYLLSPTYVEFWIGREGRFHDRFTYQKVENAWIGQRLYP